MRDTDSTRADRERVRLRARQAALRELARRHPAEYEAVLEEQLLEARGVGRMKGRPAAAA